MSRRDRECEEDKKRGVEKEERTEAKSSKVKRNDGRRKRKRRGKKGGIEEGEKGD